MFKAIVLLALVAFACGSDPILGGYYASQDITQAVVDTANWATNELTTTYNYAGEYHTANIRDYTVQVVSGYNRRFTVDYVVVFGDNNYRFVSCKYGVYEVLWQNYREIFEGPTCTDWIPN